MDTSTLVKSDIFSHTRPSMSKIKRWAWVRGYQISSLCSWRARCATIRHVMSLWTSVGISMERPPYHDIVPECPWPSIAVWCKYSSSETDDRIAS